MEDKKDSEKNNKQKKFPFMLLFISIVAVVLILLGVKGFTGLSILSDKQEVTKIDVLKDFNEFSAEKVSVKGISLGSKAEEVAEKLGKPDIQTLHPPNIANFEYGPSLGYPNIALLIHMEAGYVTRMTVRKIFNDKLIGNTKINYNKEGIYKKFGVPDNQKFQPISNTEAVKIMSYDKKGLEIITDGGDAVAFSLFYPVEERSELTK